MYTPIDQITIGAIAAFVYQLLKKSTWFPFVTEESAKVVKVGLAAVFAWASTLGIHFAFDPQTHVLLISGLTLSGVTGSLWLLVKQFVVQEGWFQLAIKPGSTAPPGEKP